MYMMYVFLNPPEKSVNHFHRVILPQFRLGEITRIPCPNRIPGLVLASVFGPLLVRVLNDSGYGSRPIGLIIRGMNQHFAEFGFLENPL
jgi:hypothetical protein